MDIQEHDEVGEEFSVVLLDRGRTKQPAKFQTRTVEIHLGLERTESEDGYFHKYTGEGLIEVANMLGVELTDQHVVLNIYNVRETFGLSIFSDTVGLFAINSKELLVSRDRVYLCPSASIRFYSSGFACRWDMVI